MVVVGPRPLPRPWPWLRPWVAMGHGRPWLPLVMGRGGLPDHVLPHLADDHDGIALDVIIVHVLFQIASVANDRFDE